MAQRRKRPRRIDVEIREQIETLANERLSGPQIQERLSLNKEFAARVPSLRTIQSVMREALVPAVRADAEAWTVATAAADEAQHVLPVLGCVIDRTRGRVTQLRRDHAAWVARIRAAVPHLGEWRIYLEAGQYADAVERGISTAAIDRRLASLAWEPGKEAEEAAGEAWARGSGARTISYTPGTLRGMARVPAAEVSVDVRFQVEHARQELLEDESND